MKNVFEPQHILSYSKTKILKKVLFTMIEKVKKNSAKFSF